MSKEIVLSNWEDLPTNARIPSEDVVVSSIGFDGSRMYSRFMLGFEVLNKRTDCCLPAVHTMLLHMNLDASFIKLNCGTIFT
jgi:hypothetical protein